MKEIAMQDVTTIHRITHEEAMELTAVENRKVADQFAALTAGDWTRQTDCPRWDVRAMAAHMVGSTASQASAREFARQARRGRPITKEIGGAFWWDGMNELQVREREHMSVEELRTEWDSGSARALKARKTLPKPIGALPLLNLPVVGRKPVRYLFDMGFTRDAWMHRIDIASAVGRPIEADEHDRRIVADLIAEWAGTHGEPFHLELSGPAGGSYRAGSGGETVAMDAIAFARILAMRGTGTGILRNPLPL